MSSHIDWKRIYPKGVDAELCSGYYDGRRPASVEPDHKAHPAYIHGFLNGRDDIRSKPRKTAEELRKDIAYIEAVFSEEI